MSKPRWTKEQQEAIDKEGMNIIVSAGAGSGKTAVLSERALRKVSSGVDVDRLLILTFTKAAAYEMMIRIRDKIKAAGLVDQVEKIERAYITTFDSFALSVVKKYHSVLNISSQVRIIDASVISMVKKEFLNEIFEELYVSQDSKFYHLIRDFCMKDDQELKDSILKLNEKLDMKYDKKEYLDTYLERFREEKLEKDIVLFEQQLKGELKRVEPELEKIRLEVDGDFFGKILDVLNPLFESVNYDDLKNGLNCKLPILPRGSSDTVKKSKESIGKILDALRAKCLYEDRSEILSTILSTKDYVEIILEIIRQLDQKIFDYKHEHDVYEFVDISKLAIRVVFEHSEIRKELQNYFAEIMIDEYQDTSDLQETFIRLIEKDNVYMVGDIKQSIYRFRNANPYIFKEKYDRYALGVGGYKIDLVQNFRSRKEVLDDINHIFDLIMDDSFGGADYSVSHRMVFGNQAYIEKGSTEQNYKTEIFNYTYEKDSEYTKDEIEAFLVAHDIQEKVKNHYQVFDKDKKELRDISYQDFVILMDRSSKFELYKKIFEYNHIPLTILKDENIMNQIEVYLIHHLIQLILKVSKREFDDVFRYAFLSVGRSYLFEMSDATLFQVLRDRTYCNTELYRHIESLLSDFSSIDIENFLVRLIEKFGFYTKVVLVGDVELATNNLEYLIETAHNLKLLGYTLEDFSLYLTDIIEGKKEIKLPTNSSTSDDVKIMTIHKSKGLEYHVCYYTGLYAPFNVSDLKERILFDNTYGIITPYFKDGYGDTIYKSLLKEKFYADEISEKIRLFYVALTRCKEKMILITDLKEEENNLEDGKVEDNRRLKYRSFLEFLKSIYEQLTDYITDIDLKTIPLSLDYKKRNSKNIKEVLSVGEGIPSVSEIQISNEVEVRETFSKKVKGLFNKEQLQSLEFGRKIHLMLEYLDFNNPDWSLIDPWLQQKLQIFLNQPLLANRQNATIYKEYEFITNIDGKELHGVIDLMLVYPDHIDIIDYKLKGIEDQAYINQLKGYQSYIQNLTKRDTYIYLYSILDENLINL